MKSNSAIYLYALFSRSNSALAKILEPKVSQHELVAANIITSNSSLQAEININTAQNSQYSFKLDCSSQSYVSRGNWLWINQFNIYSSHSEILTLTIDPKIVDIPYSGDDICAYWFFKNFYEELSEYMKSYS